MIDNPFANVPVFTPPKTEEAQASELPADSGAELPADSGKEINEIQADASKAEELNPILAKKKELQEEMSAIIKEFGGVGSIPHGHRYYTLANQLRILFGGTN